MISGVGLSSLYISANNRGARLLLDDFVCGQAAQHLEGWPSKADTSSTAPIADKKRFANMR